MDKVKKLGFIFQIRQCIDVLPLAEFLGLICAEDAGKIRVAMRAHYPTFHYNFQTGCFTMVPWENFCRIAPKRDELTEETNALFRQLLDDNGPTFYVQVDCS